MTRPTRTARGPRCSPGTGRRGRARARTRRRPPAGSAAARGRRTSGGTGTASREGPLVASLDRSGSGEVVEELAHTGGPGVEGEDQGGPLPAGPAPARVGAGRVVEALEEGGAEGV